MLNAIAFWAESFKLIECWNRREKGYQVADLGRSLLDTETGADPYLEDIQSLWILQWQLVKSPQVAKAWNWFFNYNYAPESTKHSLINRLQEWSQEQGDTIAEASLKADLKCLLKMYLPGDGRIEDEVCYLFPELQLIQQIEGSTKGNRHIFFNLNAKPGLTLPLFGYLCIDYAESLKVKQIDFAQLQYQPGCPNRAMMLSTGAFMDLLDRWLSSQTDVKFVEEEKQQFIQWQCST